MKQLIEDGFNQGDSRMQSGESIDGSVEGNVPLDLAQRVCDQFSEIMSVGMIVAIQEGEIIAASDKSRIGNKHAGAARIMRHEVDSISVDAEQAEASGFKMREGFNIAIELDGDRMCSIGFAGPPSIVSPLAKLAKSWLESELRVNQSTVTRREDMRRSAENIEGVLELIQAIAKQTKLLSLNASIEAARAGDAGRGFGVVAGEVKNMSEQTNDAVEAIKEQVTAMRLSV